MDLNTAIERIDALTLEKQALVKALREFAPKIHEVMAENAKLRESLFEAQILVANHEADRRCSSDGWAAVEKHIDRERLLEKELSEAADKNKGNSELICELQGKNKSLAVEVRSLRKIADDLRSNAKSPKKQPKLRARADEIFRRRNPQTTAGIMTSGGKELEYVRLLLEREAPELPI